jgi:hypothetical protein
VSFVRPFTDLGGYDEFGSFHEATQEAFNDVYRNILHLPPRSTTPPVYRNPR